VAVARAMSIDARIVIMDEPTAALSMKEIKELFLLIEFLKSEGKAVLFISHKFDEIYRIADRYTVFRDGEMVGEGLLKDTGQNEIVRMMVGRNVDHIFPRRDPKIGAPVLSVSGLSHPTEFDDIGFELRKGEILGFYGLVGAGRSEVMQAIAGITRTSRGAISLDGRTIAPKSAADSIEAGIVYVPEERGKQGVVIGMPIFQNVSLPSLARAAPRPGRWMEVLKQGLAFPMYAAAVWLLWVVSQEAGPSGVLGTASGFVLLGFAGWLLGVSQAASGRNRRFGQSAAVATVLAALAVLSGIAVAPGTPAAASSIEGVEPFSPARLAALRAEGRPVFVNMTAAWCVTCLVNERVALDSQSVREAFARGDVAYLKGDWTRQDPAITEYLRQNGRDGVPLYVFYPPKGQPVVLPQILTENTVLAELPRS